MAQGNTDRKGITMIEQLASCSVVERHFAASAGDESSRFYGLSRGGIALALAGLPRVRDGRTIPVHIDGEYYYADVPAENAYSGGYGSQPRVESV